MRVLGAFLFLFSFLGYGAVIETLPTVMRGNGTVVTAQAVSLGIGGLVWLVCCAATWRYRRSLTLITRLLNTMSVCLVLVPMFVVGYNFYEQYEYGVDHGADDGGRVATSEALLQYPDVYYIVPDSYGRTDVIADSIGYDKSPFLDGLLTRERGRARGKSGFEIISVF